MFKKKKAICLMSYFLASVITLTEYDITTSLEYVRPKLIDYVIYTLISIHFKFTNNITNFLTSHAILSEYYKLLILTFSSDVLRKVIFG